MKLPHEIYTSASVAHRGETRTIQSSFENFLNKSVCFFRIFWCCCLPYPMLRLPEPLGVLLPTHCTHSFDCHRLSSRIKASTSDLRFFSSLPPQQHRFPIQEPNNSVGIPQPRQQYVVLLFSSFRFWMRSLVETRDCRPSN